MQLIILQTLISIDKVDRINRLTHAYKNSKAPFALCFELSRVSINKKVKLKKLQRQKVHKNLWMDLTFFCDVETSNFDQASKVMPTYYCGDNPVVYLLVFDWPHANEALKTDVISSVHKKTEIQYATQSALRNLLNRLLDWIYLSYYRISTEKTPPCWQTGSPRWSVARVPKRRWISKPRPWWCHLYCCAHEIIGSAAIFIHVVSTFLWMERQPYESCDGCGQ